MADQENDNIRLRNGFDPLDPATPDIYSNAVDVIINGSEISIIFGQHINVGGSASKSYVRVTMTHSNFMFFAEAMSRRAAFLKQMYRGYPPDLNRLGSDVSSEEVAEALQRMTLEDRGVDYDSLTPEDREKLLRNE